jgi:hypothetical protein
MIDTRRQDGEEEVRERRGEALLYKILTTNDDESRSCNRHLRLISAITLLILCTTHHSHDNYIRFFFDGQ